VDRTVRLLIRPTAEQAAALAEAREQFTAVFNIVCTYGWQCREQNGVRLHHATCHPLKATYPDLVSDLHVQARVKAALTRLRQGRMVRCPCSKRCPARLNYHTLTIKWTGQIAFSVSASARKYSGYRVCTADLIQRGDRFWLHVVVNVPTRSRSLRPGYWRGSRSGPSVRPSGRTTSSSGSAAGVSSKHGASDSVAPCKPKAPGRPIGISGG
jgi:hypothetical protein